jgi:hypothetical protein
MFQNRRITSLVLVFLVTGALLLPAAVAAETGPIPVANTITRAATSPVTMSCPFSNTGGDWTYRGFYITFPGDTLNTVTLQYIPLTTEMVSVTLTARLSTYDGTLVGSVTQSFEATAGVNQQVTFDFGGALVPAGSIITFAQTTASSIYYDVGNGGLGVADGTCPGFIETEGTTPPLDTFRRESVGAMVTGSLTTEDEGGVPDNPSQAGNHANSHACEDNPGRANEHRPPNVPPCR